MKYLLDIFLIAINVFIMIFSYENGHYKTALVNAAAAGACFGIMCCKMMDDYYRA